MYQGTTSVQQRASLCASRRFPLYQGTTFVQQRYTEHESTHCIIAQTYHTGTTEAVIRTDRSTQVI